MRCIFCKSISDASVSVEHIVPESLGNVEHVLSPGWVCDSCNNYLATKVEKPFLDSAYGKSTRAFMGIANKRGRITPSEGFHLASQTRVEIITPHGEQGYIAAAPGEDESRWIKSFLNKSGGTIYIPFFELPENNNITARFIAKIALEVLASRGTDIPAWNKELVDKPELDDLRRYVRRGIQNILWPIHIRRIYPQDFVFTHDLYGPHQILHEFDILSTDAGEFYGVIAIFGVEYTINLGGPELLGYYEWLRNNDNKSPLYK